MKVGGIVLFFALFHLKVGFHVGAEAEIELTKSEIKAVFLVILVGITMGNLCFL